jgi:shikimate dehydrogenase
MSETSNYEITGRTRIYGILADPIYHVKTPQVMADVFRRNGIDAVLIPFHVRPNGLAAMIRGLAAMENFGGFIATVPHKPAMFGLCDDITDEARHIGAVNCVRREPDGRMVGAMLDGIGFVTALRHQTGFDPDGKAAFVAGAGGAACAIAFALADAGAKRVTIANRTLEKAEALAGRMRMVYPELEVTTDAQSVADHDLVVNGTSLGMKPDDAEPLDFARLKPSQVVADAIMDPVITPLLKAAQEKGCRIQRGLPMLQCQIELMARHMGAIA